MLRGDFECLKESIAEYTNGLATLPPVHPTRPHFLTMLASALRWKINELGNASDAERTTLYDKIVQLDTEALALCDPADINTCVDNLSDRLREQHALDGDSNQSAAIENFNLWLKSSPEVSSSKVTLEFDPLDGHFNIFNASDAKLFVYLFYFDPTTWVTEVLTALGSCRTNSDLLNSASFPRTVIRLELSSRMKERCAFQQIEN